MYIIQANCRKSVYTQLNNHNEKIVYSSNLTRYGRIICVLPIIKKQVLKNKKALNNQGFFDICGGERGSRTLDTLRYTHFPGVLLRPLGHLTLYNFYHCKAKKIGFEIQLHCPFRRVANVHNGLHKRNAILQARGEKIALFPRACAALAR
jgi:hypothetical protein